MPVVNSTVTFQTENTLETAKEHVHTRRRKRKGPNPFKRRMMIHKPTGVVFLCYRGNKIVMLGAKTLDTALNCVEWFLNVTSTSILVMPMIRNIVYIYDTAEKLNLLELSKSLQMEYPVSYEPESCPALVLDDKSTGATILIYASGKITITGVSSSEQLSASLGRVSRLLGCNKPLQQGSSGTDNDYRLKPH